MAINTALDTMSDQRQAVAMALQDAQTCGHSSGLTADIAALQRAATDRQYLSLPGSMSDSSALQTGEQLTTTLRTALSDSAEADRQYAIWAKHLAEGTCHVPAPTSDPAYVNATTASNRATKAKKAFVDLWNPVAEQYGLPEREADKL